MKTIRDIAIEYYTQYAFMGNDQSLTEKHFEEGAEWMREELTRWHDPKEKLPRNDARVLCKVDGCEIAEYLVLNYYEGSWWSCRTYEVTDDYSEDSWIPFGGVVIGWREIYENEK